MRAVPRRQGAEIEEGDVRSGRRQPICVEEVIGADIVLVDGLLDETHTEIARIERTVPACVGGDGCQMMDSGELHDDPRSVIAVA
jgi:hypothetical protein